MPTGPQLQQQPPPQQTPVYPTAGNMTYHSQGKEEENKNKKDKNKSKGGYNAWGCNAWLDACLACLTCGTS
jgi:hypothetical protein